MRWVVSLLLILLLFPIATALTVSFDTTTDSYYKMSPVNISFTTDDLANCSYTITTINHQPDFSCKPHTCDFISCEFGCPDKEVREEITGIYYLGESNNNFSLSVDLLYGFYDLEVTCTNDEGQIAKRSTSFLHDSRPFYIDWSLLSRERFSKTQKSTFYAYIRGDGNKQLINVSLTQPDYSNITYSYNPIITADGYLFSFPLDDVAVSGKYSLELLFTYVGGEYVLTKDFLVVDTASFEIDIASDNTLFDIKLFDPISGVQTFVVNDISAKKIAVPASRLDMLLESDDIFSLYFQKLDMVNFDLDAIYDTSYHLETELIGANKPLKELASYIFHTNNSPEYIVKVEFDFSSLNVLNPDKLQLFKADAKSSDSVDITSGEFYKIGSQRTPLYVDKIAQTAHIFVKDFSLFSLVEERQIGTIIDRDASTSFINLSLDPLSLEGIGRDTWTFTFKEKQFSFMINSIDGAIVYFEFSPKGEIVRANVGSAFLHDLDDDETDDISFYVKAITPSKILFQVTMLTQPESASSLEEIIGSIEPLPDKYKLYFSSGPLFYVYLGLALLILFFAIIWFIVHGHHKPAGLSDYEKQRLDDVNGSTKHPVLVYIEASREKKVEEKYIKSHLLAAGWPEDLVDNLINNSSIDERIIEEEKEIIVDNNKKKQEVISAEILNISAEDNVSLDNQLEKIEKDFNSQESEIITTKKIQTEEKPIAVESSKSHSQITGISHEEKMILDYLSVKLSHGETRENIRKNLEGVGWDKKLLDNVFDKVI